MNKEDIDLIAKLANEANNDVREYFQQEKTTGEHSPDNVILDAINFKFNPSAAFQAWKASKLHAGWKGGKELSYSDKTHPNLLIEDYEDLPFQEKVKDFVFLTAVKTAARAIKELRDGN